uniref:Uncharacterized protein n=1 Tax=Siphoviridae sp. ctB3v5 TaxID=2826186 RepID=A0A8S5M9E2_9CAUD|nr:MAG TPA: hypothetical protein [Siphoviridae sp. ctB3v5]
MSQVPNLVARKGFTNSNIMIIKKDVSVPFMILN